MVTEYSGTQQQLRFFFFPWTYLSPVNYILFLLWNAGTWEPATRPRGPTPPALWLSASEFRGHRAEWLETDVLGQQMQLLIELGAGDSGGVESGCTATSRIDWSNVTLVSPARIQGCCQTTLTHRTNRHTEITSSLGAKSGQTSWRELHGQMRTDAMETVMGIT